MREAARSSPSRAPFGYRRTVTQRYPAIRPTFEPFARSVLRVRPRQMIGDQLRAACAASGRRRIRNATITVEREVRRVARSLADPTEKNVAR